MTAALPPSDTDRQTALAREWDDLVEQARQLPGFENFLRPPDIATMRSAAIGGPVVIVNVSRWRCDALVIRPECVTEVSLPGLTADSVIHEVNRYLRTVVSFQEESGLHQQAQQALLKSGRDRPALAAYASAMRRWGRAREQAEAELDHCLVWMWDSFVEKILNHLQLTAPVGGTGSWPRVWWCPTGPLTLLPIHAAGRHSRPNEAALDRVVSSYTPTLRALIQSRVQNSPEAVHRMLFVGLQRTPGQPNLPNVRREQQLVEQLLPDRHLCLTEQAATRAAVLEQLPGHAWVHFSCHGNQNLGDPSRGGLHLHDGMLTVGEVGAKEYRGELAYLSGCKTAVGGVNLPDEAITLAASLNYSGYRHVIATLWSVSDQHAAEVAEDVYRGLVHDDTLDARNAGVALHRAVISLREKYRDHPSIWMPYMHIGP
ncbi:CHAT domain-containing protein [Streptomyces fuscichromogenes]|uniref:CHAT domain-containing protein n=1 Tax=Streptomyces fuscichromogenes TaxID=1324013 RepID=UPI00380E5A89